MKKQYTMTSFTQYSKTTMAAAAALTLVMLSGCATKSVVAEPEGLPDSAYVVAKNLPQALDRSEARIKKNQALLQDLEQKKSIPVQPVEHVQQLDARSADDKRKIRGPQFPPQAAPAPLTAATSMPVGTPNSVGGNIGSPVMLGGTPGMLNNPGSLAPTNINNTPNTTPNANPGLTPVIPVSSTPVAAPAGVVQPLETAKDVVGTDSAKVAKLNTPIRSVEWKNSSFNEFVRKIGSHVGYTVVVIDKAGNNITNRDTLLSLQEDNKTPLAILSKAADMNQSMLSITVSHVRQKIIIAYK